MQRDQRALGERQRQRGEGLCNLRHVIYHPESLQLLNHTSNAPCAGTGQTRTSGFKPGLKVKQEASRDCSVDGATQ
eukprot:7750099-Pyramimonas_sp.AAC.1